MQKPLRALLGRLSRFVSAASHAFSNSDQRRNNTEYKHLEEQLKTLSCAVEHNPSTIIVTDTSGKIEYVNPKFTQLTGYTYKEAIGQNPRILKTDKTPPEVYESLWKVITSGKEWHGEFCNKKKNGELYWESASISPVKNGEGSITHFVAVKEDITERKKMEEKLKLFNKYLEERVATRTEELREKNVELMNEIAERKRAEEELRASEEMLSRAQRISSMGIWEWDKVKEEIIWSKETCLLFGLKPDGFDGKYETFLNLVHPEDRKLVTESVKASFSKKSPYNIDFRIVLRNGEERIIHSEAQVEFDKMDTPIRMTGISQNITERKQTEEALLLHSRILENMNEGVNLVKAKDGVIVYTNTQFNNLFGYEHGELVGKHVSALNATVDVTPEEKAEEIIRALNDKGSWAGEIRNIRKDGTEFWCRANVSSFSHPEFGNVWVSAHEDITERKNTELKLASQEVLFRVLVETIPHVIWVGDAEGNITFINKAWKEWTGRNIADSLGDKWAESLHPDDAEELLAKWERAYKHSEPYTGECRFATKDGSYKTATFIGMPVRDASGKTTNWVGIDMDITERKLMEEQIKTSLREKEVLLDEVHHRVKNNLQIISSLLDMSSMQTQNQETIKLFAESRNRVESIALIHSQLYESERFDEINMEMHIQELSGSLLNIYSKEKTITIDIKSTNVYFPVTLAVPCALVLNELISNSLKHAYRDGQQGVISISMQQSNDGTTIFKVKDTGVGISEEIDIERAKSLGLKLIRNIVYRQLNGTMKVVRNSGTEFTIEFKHSKEDS